MSRKIGSVDLETGEVLPHVLVAVQQRVPIGFREGWLSMSQTATDMFAEIKNADDHRVLWALLGRLNFENLINIEQVSLAEKLGMQKQNVNRSIKRLIAMGVLLEGQKVGRTRTYQLNPNYGWKGSTKNHQEALRTTAEKAKSKGFKVVKGGQMSDAELRAKMEAEGQSRLFD